MTNAHSGERSASHAADTYRHPTSRMRAGSEHDELHSSPKQHAEVACKSPAAAHKARKSGVLRQGTRPIASTPSSCCFTEGDYPSDFSSLSHDCVTAGAATIDPNEAMLAASPTPPPPRRRRALGPDASGLPTPPALKRSASKSPASNQVAAKAAPPSQPQKLKRALGSPPAHSRHSALVVKKQSPAPPVFGDATAADDDANSPTLATAAGRPNAQQSEWHTPGVATSPSDAPNAPQRVTKVPWQAGPTPCSAAALPARAAGAECHSVRLRTASSPMGPKQKRVCFERDAVAALSDAFSKFVPAASPVYSAQHSLVFEGQPAVTGDIGSKASKHSSQQAACAADNVDELGELAESPAGLTFAPTNSTGSQARGKAMAGKLQGSAQHNAAQQQGADSEATPDDSPLASASVLRQLPRAHKRSAEPPEPSLLPTGASSLESNSMADNKPSTTPSPGAVSPSTQRAHKSLLRELCTARSSRSAGSFGSISLPSDWDASPAQQASEEQPTATTGATAVADVAAAEDSNAPEQMLAQVPQDSKPQVSFLVKVHSRESLCVIPDGLVPNTVKHFEASGGVFGVGNSTALPSDARLQLGQDAAATPSESAGPELAVGEHDVADGVGRSEQRRKRPRKPVTPCRSADA